MRKTAQAHAGIVASRGSAVGNHPKCNGASALSENITHTAIVDDSLRLACAAAWLPKPLAAACKAHPAMTRLGGSARLGDRFTVGILTALRQTLAAGEPLSEAQQGRAAFTLGWLSHRAADRQMKPVFRQTCPDAPEKPTDCSIYHDVFVFREVYDNGRREPYHGDLLQPETLDAAADANVVAMEELLGVLLRRRLIAIHTLKPDGDDVESWLDRLLGLVQWSTVNVQRYAEALAHPDPDKVRRFIVETNFYDRDEPIIDAARRLREADDALPADEVAAAVLARAASHYALALQTACGYLRAAGQFVTTDMAPDELAKRFDIGKLGRDGKPV